MFWKNELFICDLCITVIETDKNQEFSLNGPRSKYDHHLNNWAIVQKSNLHIYLCILLWIVLPFLILSWKTILPVCYFTSSNTHIWGLEAPSSWHSPARWGFQTFTWAGDSNQINGNTFHPGYQLWEFSEIWQCGSQRISENWKKAGKSWKTGLVGLENTMFCMQPLV